MKYLGLFFYTIAISSFLGCNKVGSQDVLTHLSPKEFQTSIVDKNVQIIDVRKPEEFNQGYIPDAINIDYLSEDFASTIDGLDKKKPVYIYCRSGKRSVKSVIHFKELGFTQIYNLEGGILNWESEGFPLDNTN